MSRFLKNAAVSLSLLLILISGSCYSAQKADLIIKNAYILSIDSNKTVYKNGSIVVRGDTIVAIGGEGLEEEYLSDTVIDAGGDIVMPGMINLHNHIPMIAFRGLGENGVADRLFKFYFPLEKAMLSRDLIRIASRHAAIELALSGVTLVTDMYYHEDEVARAVAEVGIRGVLGETVIQFPVVDAAEPYGGLAYARKYIEDWKDHPLITPAIAPHAPYTVTPEWLLKSKALAEELGVPILIHVGEFRNEADLISERIGDFPSGKSVVAYLDQIGFLADSVVAAHVNYVDKKDMELLELRGVGVAHNPKANSLANSGMSPAWEMHKLNLDIGFGTDGPLSSNQMDIMSAMSYAAAVARLRGNDSTLFTPYELVYMATMGGARALDMEDQIGSLEVGKKADIIIVDVHATNMQPAYDLYANLAFSAYPENVQTTIVNGRIIVRDRVVQSVDEDAHWQEWMPLTKRVADFSKTLE